MLANVHTTSTNMAVELYMLQMPSVAMRRRNFRRKLELASRGGGSRVVYEELLVIQYT